MVKCVTKIIGGVCECITIEIIMEKQKNIIVSCICRAPSSNIDTFRETVENLFAKSEQKVLFFCGEFDINLLNQSKHSATDEFTTAMYSMGLYPMITKPSRITSHSPTLILIYLLITWEII